MGQGYEHLRFPPPALNNMYVTVNFMQELAEQLETDFPDRLRALYPDAEYVGMEAGRRVRGDQLLGAGRQPAGTTEQGCRAPGAGDEPHLRGSRRVR